MMNKKTIIEVVKFTSALVIGVAIGAATRPAVNELFKLNKKEEVDTIPSVDIEEDDVSDEE